MRDLEELSQQLRASYPRPSQAATERARVAVHRAATGRTFRLREITPTHGQRSTVRSLTLLLAGLLLLLTGGAVAASSETGFPFTLHSKSPTSPPPTSLLDSHLVDAQRLTPRDGWALTDKLELTDDEGETWRDITPAGVDPTAIRAVYFFNPENGWLLTTRMTGSTSAPLGQLVVYRTVTGGRSWESRDVGTPSASASDATAGPAAFDFISARTGWLSVTLPTSASFSNGLLFATSDGGASWTERTIPIGAPVAFATASDGWTAGGVAAGGAFVTHDGGSSWQPANLSAPPGVTGTPAYAIPDVSPGPATAISATYRGQNATLVWFTTSDNGQSFTASTPAASGEQFSGGAIIDSGQAGSTLGSIFPNADRVIWATGGTSFVRSASGFPSNPSLSITRLSISSNKEAWAVIGGEACAPSGRECSGSKRFAGLYSTDDGGANWTQLHP